MQAHFNPTLVQLEVVARGQRQEALLFQSHIGAIRSEKYLQRFSTTDKDFNPTLVQLEVKKNEKTKRGNENFNPTLVQLEVILRGNVAKQVEVFQSHIGAIRSIEGVGVPVTGASQNFNPTLVQLEVQ